MIKQTVFELESEWKEAMLNAMQDGVDIADGVLKKMRLVTQNGRNEMLWNSMNTEVKNVLPNDRFIVLPTNRGIWQFIIVYDTETKIIYTLMKSARFKDVRHKYEKCNGKVHYLECLAELNRSYCEVEYFQTSFLEDNIDRAEEKEKVLCKMLNDIREQAEKYILITFELEKKEIKLPQANLLSPNLDIMEVEDWRQYITLAYDAVLNMEEIDEVNDVNEEEFDVTLKPNIIPFTYDKKENSQVDIKQIEQSKDSK